MTALQQALAKAGFSRRDNRLLIALAEFRNNGGDRDEAQALLDLAYEKGSAGQGCGAEEAGSRLPSASRTDDDGWGQRTIADKADEHKPRSSSPHAAAGQSDFADKAGWGMPAAARQREGADRCTVAEKAGLVMPASSRPAKPPRGAAAIAGIQATLARSLFDQTRLPDGRSLREVRWAECPQLAQRYRKLSRILMAVHGHAVPADPGTTLDNIVTEDGLKQIVEAVERFNDIH